MPADPVLLDADRKARCDALDVRRSFIVQAPAGSGKTELLIQRYLKLLAIVDEPEEVVAITFTRKAAAEMQDRVIEALKNTRAGTSSDQEHEQITIDAAAAALERDGGRDWRLVESPRRMRIQTLDGFCASTTRLLPLTSGLGGIGNTVEDNDARELYRTAALATLDWLVGDDPVGTAVEQVLTHLDVNTAAYVGYVSRMLENRDQWLEIVGSGDVAEPERVRARLESNLADVVRHHLTGARRRLERAGVEALPPPGRHAADSAEHASPAEDQTPLPGAAPADLPAWRAVARQLLTRAGQWRKSINRTQGFAPEDRAAKRGWLDLIGRLSTDRELMRILQLVRTLPNPRYEDRQWQVLLALFRVLPLAVSELRRLFAEQGVCDHVEVALAADAALGSADSPGDAALMLDYRIRHLLVDEMQDTSIAQYRMLETLTAGWEPGDGRTFFCVGDPMQSIYRFRNAEVGQFARARANGLGGLPLESLILRRNFRSGEHLVRWFNSVFGQVFPAEDDTASGAVPYTDSIPTDRLLGRGDYRLHPLFNVDAEAEALYAAEVVEACLGRAEDEDVAVLVRSRTQLPALLAELRRKDIRYRAIEIDRLTDLPEIIDVMALTRACCHLDDRAAWLALLRGPYVGLGWADLHRLVHDAPGQPVWALLRDSARRSALSPYARGALAEFLPRMRRALRPDCMLTLRQRVETAWFRFGGPALLRNRDQLANVYRYFDVLETVEAAGTLPDPAELKQRLDEERVSTSGGGDCRVQVLTMHKAKGLQFDHVILPALGRYTTVGHKRVLSWLNVPADAGGSDLILSPIGPSYELERDPLHQYIERALRQSDQLELDRLLYVACTRAKKSLHLIAGVQVKDGVRAPHSGSLLYRLWPALQSTIEAAHADRVTAVGDAEEEIDGDVFVRPRLRRVDGGWRMPEPPDAPVRRGPSVQARQQGDKRIEYHWVGAAARHAGSIVHRWLRRFVADGVWPTPDRLDTTEQLTRRWALLSGVPEAELAAVNARVLSALRGILNDARGRWILDGPGAAELALTGAWRGGTASIVIDRVRIDADGTHWIIDYKTSTHEGGDMRGFLDQEAERYAAQLARYAAVYRAYAGTDAVRAALYFPLLQQFREVEVRESAADAD